MELCAFEGRHADRETLRSFVDTLNSIQTRHANAVQTMAQGVLELKEAHVVDPQTEGSIQYFLDRFYMSRMSTRMLVNQHTMLFGHPDHRDSRTSRVGVIDTQCKIKELVEAAFENATFLCEEYYFCSPDLELHEFNSVDPGAPIFLAYPPPNLFHITYELLKNSMRATIETRKKNILELPPIKIQITKGDSDVTIKISDQGGGISRATMDNLFHYLYSTAPRPSMHASKTPLAGYGYGLPLSRLYARYFHGDLVLSSFDGYGTDAVVYLKTCPLEAIELLPVFNKTSTKQYKTTVPAADWTDPSSTMNRLYHPQYNTIWATGGARY